MILLFGSIISGLLQIAGYVLYIRDEEIEPNPVAWLMFAYGTAILTVLEFDRNATVYELVLPALCAIMGMFVAYRCWQRARVKNPMHWWPRDWWPEDWEDRAAFVGDLLITIAYIGAWILLYGSFVDETMRSDAALVFLLGSNATTFVAFIPLLRAAHRTPEKERALPWIIWTIAYTTLFAITYSTHGLRTELIIYPASCMILHGYVAFLVRSSRRGQVLSQRATL